jgi:hypothetical protein
MEESDFVVVICLVVLLSNVDVIRAHCENWWWAFPRCAQGNGDCVHTCSVEVFADVACVLVFCGFSEPLVVTNSLSLSHSSSFSSQLRWLSCVACRSLSLFALQIHLEHMAARGGSSTKKTKKSQAIELSADMEECLSILQQLMQKEEAAAFNEPVDWEGLGLPDYPDIVKHPMDLGTVLVRVYVCMYVCVWIYECMQVCELANVN